MSRMPGTVALAAIATLLSPVSHGQEKTFEIRGSVVGRDQVLADVEVSLRAKGTRKGRDTVTDLSGAFSFTGVPPGAYDLRAGPESALVLVPPPPSAQVSLSVDRDLTLILPVEGGFCTQMPDVMHYFRLPGPDREKDSTALSGTVKGKAMNPSQSISILQSCRNVRGTSIEGASVALYIPRLGRAATTRTKRGGAFFFGRLKTDENYWIQVLSKGYFPGEVTRLKVLSGYESIYDHLTLEACEPGHCDPSIRKIPIGPACE